LVLIDECALLFSKKRMELRRLIDLDGVVRRKKEVAKTSIYLA
jgi:hypothetical protein